MYIVLITALGVGGATIFGAVIGFVFKGVSKKYSNVVLAFSGGVMLLAAINGLILPSLEYESKYSLLICVLGIFFGALLIFILDKLVPHITKMADESENSKKRNKVILFTLAIAIHNLPEGIAAGVGFGTGDVSSALTLALAIALQNIPEGMVIISPMIAAGISPGKTFIYAALTGVIEIFGTFIGYFAVSLATVVLPFALALAGGSMIYVISDEIIPETHCEDAKAVSFSFLFGFCFMLVLTYLI
ncbi:MAG: ZIP family metal transporter [Clostridia bacterium]|nr:ZIP family metal transporter [Clostridia bacterium]